MGNAVVLLGEPYKGLAPAWATVQRLFARYASVPASSPSLTSPLSSAPPTPVLTDTAALAFFRALCEELKVPFEEAIAQRLIAFALEESEAQGITEALLRDLLVPAQVGSAPAPGLARVPSPAPLAASLPASTAPRLKASWTLTRTSENQAIRRRPDFLNRNSHKLEMIQERDEPVPVSCAALVPPRGEPAPLRRRSRSTPHLPAPSTPAPLHTPSIADSTPALAPRHSVSDSAPPGAGLNAAGAPRASLSEAGAHASEAIEPSRARRVVSQSHRSVVEIFDDDATVALAPPAPLPSRSSLSTPIATLNSAKLPPEMPPTEKDRVSKEDKEKPDIVGNRRRFLKHASTSMRQMIKSPFSSTASAAVGDVGSAATVAAPPVSPRSPRAARASDKTRILIAVEILRCAGLSVSDRVDTFYISISHRKELSDKSKRQRILNALESDAVPNAAHPTWEGFPLSARTFFTEIHKDSFVMVNLVHNRSSSAVEVLATLMWDFNSLIGMRQFRHPQEEVALPLADSKGQIVGEFVCRLSLGNKEVKLAAARIERAQSALDLKRPSALGAPYLPLSSISALFASLTGLLRTELPPVDFRTFLLKYQKEELAVEAVAELVARLERSASAAALSRLGFERYLKSPRNSWLKAEHTTPSQDMSLPLTHYYIASSHNTYLLGHQITGQATLEGYVHALERNCRCIEVDVLSSGTRGLIVKHMHCPTGSVDLADVLAVIKQHAFTHTEFPLIISIEINCSKESQKKLAAMLTDILGDLLPPRFEALSPQSPPSPVKGKSATPLLSRNSARNSVDTQRLPLSEFCPMKLKRKILLKAGPERELAEEMLRITHIVIVEHGKWEQMKLSWQPWQISNLSEVQANALASSHDDRANFIEYNSRQLTRVYPKGTRVDSSNFNPLSHWRTGAQMVAMNYQSYAPPMWKHEGWFLGNGGCGYVLKPPYMYHELYSAFPSPAFAAANTSLLYLKVYTGWKLPRVATSAPAYTLRIEVNDVRGQVTRQTAPAKTWVNQLQWNEDFLFTIVAPELSTLLIMLRDETSATVLAYAAIRIDYLREGIRRVPLKDKSGLPLSGEYENAALLIHTELQKQTRGIPPSETDAVVEDGAS